MFLNIKSSLLKTFLDIIFEYQSKFVTKIIIFYYNKAIFNFKDTINYLNYK